MKKQTGRGGAILPRDAGHTPYTPNDPSAELAYVREALSADYEVLDELGRGAMGVVYRARERGIDRLVAVKVLPAHLTSAQEVVERFEREGRVAAQLEHPGIVPVYRVGRAGEVIYFVMKLLRGQSLSARLKKGGAMGAPEVRHVLVETARALGYAAARGVVHRDVKPDNIVLDQDGRPVLTDFGIARSAVDPKLTAAGIAIGTPHYMSPEQARAQALDGRSDLYSLGVVAYECLVGRPPFDGEDAVATLVAHCNEPVPRPALASDEEWSVFDVIERMLAKDPNDRFQSADELIAALGAGPDVVGAGWPPGGIRVRWWRTSSRRIADWLRRHPWWLVLAGVCLVAGAAIGVAEGGGEVRAERSRCLDADSGARAGDFAVLVDQLRPGTAGRDLDVFFDVCGLSKGKPYTATITVSRLETGRRGAVKSGASVFAARVSGAGAAGGVRQRQRLDFDRVPAGRYVLSVAVVDGAGRQRQRRTAFQLAAAR